MTRGAQGFDEKLIGARINEGHCIRKPREEMAADTRISAQLEKLREILDLQKSSI